MTTESLTYKELAERLGVKLESARKTVLRKRWQKVTANDGTVRILVPVEALPRPSDNAGDSPSDGHGDSPSDSPSPDVLALEAQIDGLKALVVSEQRRADAAEADRDAWRTQAQRSVFSRLFG